MVEDKTWPDAKRIMRFSGAVVQILDFASVSLSRGRGKDELSKTEIERMLIDVMPTVINHGNRSRKDQTPCERLFRRLHDDYQGMRLATVLTFPEELWDVNEVYAGYYDERWTIRTILEVGRMIEGMSDPELCRILGAENPRHIKWLSGFTLKVPVPFAKATERCLAELGEGFGLETWFEVVRGICEENPFYQRQVKFFTE